MEYTEALAAEGVVCAVGAGGKKSTLYALAERLDRAVVTATVRIPPFAEYVADLVVTEAPVAAVRGNEEWPLGVVPAQERPDRYLGYDTGTVAALGEAVGEDVDALLVKADGARMRDFKAPGEREPQVPRNADTVLPVAAVDVVGEPLTEERVHRVKRVAALTDLDAGDTITAEAVATVLAHEEGGRKDVPEGATVIPVLNKVDDDALAEVGRDIAAEIHARADVPRVVLTSHARADGPLVDVV